MQLDIMWIPAIVLSLMAIYLGLTGDLAKYGLGLGIMVLVLAGIAFGWWVHGGLTNHQAMNYYYSGEANGYNRGFQAGKTIITGKSDNATILYDQLLPHMFNMLNFD